MLRRAMSMVREARQDREGFHCPRCSFVSRVETQLATHILHEHLQKPAATPATGGATP